MHSLFIGLGGAGTYAVAELEKKFLDFGYNVNQDKFLFIDTEQGIKEKYDFIGDNFISLSGDSNQSYSVQSVRNNAEEYSQATHNQALLVQGRHFFNWFDNASPSLRSNRDLTAGAEGARMFTRVMLWKNYPIIKERIKRALSYLDENNHDQRIERIYLVSGTCGGTGSGSVLDIMYMLGELQNDNQQNNVALQLTTILVMPHGYINELLTTDVRTNKYQTNAYAMLDEINACTKDFYLVSGGNDGKSFFKYRCRGEINQKPFGFDVCNSLFMLDSYDNKYKKGTLNFAQVSDNVSNFLFALESGPTAQQISNGNFCNITKTQVQSSISVPYIKGFCATGMYIAQTWEEIIRKYVKEKFIYQMFLYGFVGSDTFELPPNSQTLKYENQAFADILGNLRRGFLNNSKSDINQIFGINKKEILKSTASQMKDAVATKENKIDVIFEKNPKQVNWESLKSHMDDFLEEVRNASYSFCMNLVKRYSLRHAIALINKLDAQYNKAYLDKKELVESNCQQAIDPPLFVGDRLESCKKAFDAYIDYLVSRNLSNENDGYFDVCRNCLTAAVDNIQEEGRQLPDSDVKIKGWERRFDFYLNDLLADKTRMLIPKLPENILEQKDNLLNRYYAELVCQTDEVLPDLSWNENNGKLLYSFKKQIMDKVLQENGSWEREWFTITGNTFADHCSAITDEFMRKVIEMANSEMLSKNSGLSIPFMSEYNNLDTQAKNKVKEALVDYADVALSLTKSAEGIGTISGQIVYLSNGLNKKVGLGKELNDSTTQAVVGGQMGVDVSSSIISDRLIKLYIRSGYGFDDYEFFKQYKTAFDTYYGNPTEDKHQCYIHKDFLTAKTSGATLNELFESDARKDYQELLRELWRDKEGMVFKFAVSFLVRLLLEQKDTSLLKHFDPLDIFLKETKGDEPSKTWQIQLGITNDFKNNPGMPRYNMRSSLTLNMLESTNRAGIEPHKTYLEFWYGILKRLARQNQTFISDTKMNAVLNEVYTALYNILTTEQEQDALSEMKKRYSTYLIGSNGVIQKDDNDQPILSKWKWEDFFNDCLLGLFDK